MYYLCKVILNIYVMTEKAKRVVETIVKIVLIVGKIILRKK